MTIPSQDRSVRIRLFICLAMFFLCFTTLTIRAWKLQVLSDQRIARLEEKQLDRLIHLAPQRGTIYDAKKRELAVSIKLPSVFVDPTQMKYPKESVKQLALILQIPMETLRLKLLNSSKKFVWIKRRLDPQLEKKIHQLQLEGVYVTQEWTRFYPNRELAAQLIGFVGTDGIGLEGLERFYNDYLQSDPLIIRSQKDAKGRSIYIGEDFILDAAKGADLSLTIDSNIQHIVESELCEAAEKNDADSAMAALMNPFTGEILAMASCPQVNPNRVDHSQAKLWRNRPVEEIFEPGSTFKVFTLAAALEHKVLSPEQTVLCKNGSLLLNGKSIQSTIDKTWLNPRGILKYSNNVGVARIGLQLGQDRIVSTIEHYGFGNKTGVDLPGELNGLFHKGHSWPQVELANVSFGQGIGVTAIQMLSALSAIANGGHVVQPYLVDHAILATGEKVSLAKKNSTDTVIHESTISLLRNWMEAVTEPDGTGSKGAISGYRTAGKTGTAQNLDPETQGYSRKLVTSSFMGFAPVSHPRVAAIFVFKNPQRSANGGELAAPVFRKTMEKTLAYLGVSYDKPMQEKNRFPKQNVNPMTIVQKKSLTTVPNFYGLTIREVMNLAKEHSMDVRLHGSGIAQSQNMVEGKSKVIDVYFSSSVHFTKQPMNPKDQNKQGV